MAKTIHTLAYMVTADTRSLTSGLTLTRNELKLTNAVLDSTTGPIKKFSDELQGLNSIRDKGAISGMQYISSVNQMIAAKTAGIPVLGRFTSVLSLGNPLMVAGAVSAGAFAAGIGVITAAVAYSTIKIKEQITAIDDLMSEAETIGVSANSFQQMAVGAEFADLEIGKLSKGMETMLSFVSKASGGSSRAMKVFELIGLDAKELKNLRPEDQLRSITEALDGMANESDRVRAARDIFGDPDFLRLDTSHLIEARELISNIGAEIKKADESNFNNMDRSLKELDITLELAWRKVTFALSPAITEVADEVTGLTTEFSKLHGSAENVQLVTDFTHGLIAALKGVNKELKESESFQGPLVQMFKDMGEEVAMWGKIGRIFDEAFPGKKDSVGTVRQQVADQLPEQDKKILAELEDPVKGIRSHDDAAVAARMLEAAITPAERLKRDLEEIKVLLAFGEINQDQFDQIKASLDAANPINQTIKSLEDQLGSLQLTGDAWQYVKAQMAGANQEQLDQIAGLQFAIEEQKEFNKLQDEATAAIEGLKTPFESAREEIEKYALMLEQGMIDSDQFAGLRSKAIDKFRGTQKQEDFRNPAMLRGSQEAIAAVVNARFGNQNQTDKMVDLLEDIADNTEDDAVDMPVISSFGGG